MQNKRLGKKFICITGKGALDSSGISLPWQSFALPSLHLAVQYWVMPPLKTEGVAKGGGGERASFSPHPPVGEDQRQKA